MSEDDVLVTVAILTFNSGSTVLETLESIKEQTYNNIELIVTDDGSSDKTIEICRNWLNVNGSLFASYNLITVEANTGLPANCNRALYAAKGEWIKYIAGDDMLKKGCIEINMRFISENSDVEMLQTNADLYIESFEEANFKRTLPLDFKEFFEIKEGKSQYAFLKNVGYAICTPAVFLKRIILEKIGGFDERFSLIEDLPLWLNLTKAGKRFYYLPISTVNYRAHDKSVTTAGKKYMDAKFANNVLFFLDTYFPKEERGMRIKRLMRQLKFTAMLDNYGFNNNSLISKFLHLVSTKI